MIELSAVGFGVLLALLFNDNRVVKVLAAIGVVWMLFSCQPVHAQQQVYTDKTGATIGYGYRSGNQTTYVDRTGKTYGYEYRQGNQSTYVSPTGDYQGSKTRSWDTTDRYGVDPAQRGRSREDD